jgi:ATP-dependent Clp protease adapter protein ClpS
VAKLADALEEQIKAIFSGDTPWVTIVWDDPVNLQNYVTYVFMELFGYSKAKATELMLQVHNEGKAQGTYYSATYQQPEGKDLQPEIEQFFSDFDASLSTYRPNSNQKILSMYWFRCRFN